MGIRVEVIADIYFIDKHDTCWELAATIPKVYREFGYRRVALYVRAGAIVIVCIDVEIGAANLKGDGSDEYVIVYDDIVMDALVG